MVRERQAWESEFCPARGATTCPHKIDVPQSEPGVPWGIKQKCCWCGKEWWQYQHGGALELPDA